MHNKFSSVNFSASEYSELQDLQIRWYDVRLWYGNRLHCVILMPKPKDEFRQNTNFVKFCYYRRIVSFSSSVISNMQNPNIILIYFPGWAVIGAHSDLHSLAQNSFNAFGVSDNMPFEINLSWARATYMNVEDITTQSPDSFDAISMDWHFFYLILIPLIPAPKT